jgi:hypothetical protein
MTLSGAPFVRSRRPSGPSTTTVKRHLVDFDVPIVSGLLEGQDSGVERTLDTGFEEAVQGGKVHYFSRIRTERIRRALESHLAGSERAGLVAAQYVDATEILYGR